MRQSTELKGHAAAIEKVAFNPIKDAELCSVSADGVAKFWDVRTKACTNEVRVPCEASTLVWAPDGDYLIVGGKEKGGSGSNKLFILDRTQSTPAAVKTMPARTNDLAFCWSGKRVFVATSDGRTRILSFPDLEPVLKVNYVVGESGPDEFSLKGHSAECLSVALSPTGRTLATGGTDAIIALWDTTKWTCQRTITTMAGPVRSLSECCLVLCFSPGPIAGGAILALCLRVMLDSISHCECKSRANLFIINRLQLGRKLREWRQHRR